MNLILHVHARHFRAWLLSHLYINFECMHVSAMRQKVYGRIQKERLIFGWWLFGSHKTCLSFSDTTSFFPFSIPFCELLDCLSQQINRRRGKFLPTHAHKKLYNQVLLEKPKKQTYYPVLLLLLLNLPSSFT
jgi:hypothetical protein